MSKILVTGAGGFIASHLTETLVNEGFQVKAVVRYNSKGDWGWLEKSEVKDEIEIVAGDIRDYDFVFKAVKDCNTVFHLAALIGIPYSYVSPLAYVRTNVEGTYNVLEASKELSVNQILITSTSETYGSAQYVPIDEKHPLVGQSPYSASKIAADQFSLSYYHSFGLPVKIVRPFNTYGPRQSARAIIPTIISQLLAGKKELNLGNLFPTRDFTFVKDTVSGFMNISASDSCIGEAVNIGMGEEISIGELALKISQILGVEININQGQERIRPEKSEVTRLLCSNAKLKSSTKWKPSYNLDEGLKETIEWVRAHANLYKHHVYNI